MTVVAEREERTDALDDAVAVPGGTASAGRSLAILALVGIVTSAVAFAVSVPQIRSAQTAELGLLFAVSPAFAVALVAAPLAACLALASASRSGRALAWTALALTVLVHRLPLTIGTDAPVYSWTSKHLGVVDLISANGGVVHGLDIYQAWPGMFAAFAWLYDLTGVPPLTIAHWFPIVAQLAFTAAVYALARAAGRSVDVALAAALIAQLSNWVGQDYFSPQAVAIILALVMLALLLRSRRRPVYAWLALPVFAAITVTHQLTPYWLTAAVVALCILRLVRPRWIAIVFVGLLGGYLAVNYGVLQQFGPLVTVDAVKNVQTINIGQSSAGQAAAAFGGRLATAMLWGAAFLALVVSLWRRRRTRRSMLGVGAIAFAPFGLLLGQGYGGEALFRVMLYSIAGCAILAAPWLLRLLRAPRPRTAAGATLLTAIFRARPVRIAAACAAVAALALASAQAYYGAWFAYQVQPESYRAVTELLQTAPDGSLIIGAGPGGPGRTVADYARLAESDPRFDAGISSWEGWPGSDLGDAARFDRLTRDLLWQGAPTYLVVTADMKRYSDFYGTYPEGSLDAFERLLLTDPRWDVVTTDDVVTIVRLKDDDTAG